MPQETNAAFEKSDKMTDPKQTEGICKANLTVICRDLDKSVRSDETVTRRVCLEHIIYDPNLGRRRPTSQAFQNSKNNHPMSVGIRSMLAKPEDDLVGYEGMGLVELDVKALRDLAQSVCKSPTANCSWHGLACGNKTGSVRTALSKNARWLFLPPEDKGHKRRKAP